MKALFIESCDRSRKHGNTPREVNGSVVVFTFKGDLHALDVVQTAPSCFSSRPT